MDETRIRTQLKLVSQLRLISGRIITSGCGFGLGGGVRGCGCVRRGGVSNAEHQWTVVTAVDLVADDTVTDILDQSLRHNKIVQSPVTMECTTMNPSHVCHTPPADETQS